MDRIEKLKTGSRSYARAWKEFIVKYAKHPSRLYCFFEGQDDRKYYGGRIDTIVFCKQHSLRENLWCEGKDNVLALFQLIIGDTRYRNAWVAFFIDKDFDSMAEFPSDDRLYITPCYAIENFYVSTKAFERILKDEFGISEGDQDFQATIVLYNRMLDEFNIASGELNAWIYLQRQKEKNDHAKTKLNLKNIKPQSLFSIQLYCVSKNYTIRKLENLLPNATQFPQSEIDLQVTKFSNIEKACCFRGKYLIFFLKCFLIQLAEDRNSKKNRRHFTDHKKVHLQLSGNIISELATYADTPDCLYRFIEKRAKASAMQLEMDGSI